MAKYRFDLGDPLISQALQILASQYPTSDEARGEILRGDFSGESITPRDAVAAIAAALKIAPDGFAIADLDEYVIMPTSPTQRLLDIGWPVCEIHNGRFDREGAYADLTAAGAKEKE